MKQSIWIVQSANRCELQDKAEEKRRLLSAVIANVQQTSKTSRGRSGDADLPYMGEETTDRGTLSLAMTLVA